MNAAQIGWGAAVLVASALAGCGSIAAVADLTRAWLWTPTRADGEPSRSQTVVIVALLAALAASVAAFFAGYLLIAHGLTGHWSLRSGFEDPVPYPGYRDP